MILSISIIYNNINVSNIISKYVPHKIVAINIFTIEKLESRLNRNIDKNVNFHCPLSAKQIKLSLKK